MANEPTAYCLLALASVALAAVACGDAATVAPAVGKPDGATLGAAGASGAGGAAPTTAPDAGADPGAPGAKGGSGDDASAGSGGSATDTAIEAPAPSPAPDAGGNAPAALMTYEAESGALFGKAVRVACATCSNGQRVALAPDSGVTLSSVVAPEAGTDTLVIYYTNAGTTSRSIYVGVNGGGSQMLLAVFPPTGGAGNVSSIAVPLSGFNAGANNMLTFFIDTELGAPDLDRIGLQPSSVVSGTGNACDRASWKATASVTGGDGGGPAAGIDGDLKTRWANNHPQNGTDWYQVDFGALVKLGRITLDNTQAYPNDYAGAYAVYGSLDGVRFYATPFATGNGTPGTTVINFSQRTVRAIRIAQVGSSRATNWWQIGEVELVCYQ
jgi:hypothetical protein